MSNRYYATIEQSKRDKAFFAVIEAIVKDCDRLALKHLFDSNEIKAMIMKVQFTFCFVPLKLHKHSVTTQCSYVKSAVYFLPEGV